MNLSAVRPTKVRISWTEGADPLEEIGRVRRTAIYGNPTVSWHLVVSPDAAYDLMQTTYWVPLGSVGLSPPSGAIGGVLGMWVYTEEEWRGGRVLEMRSGTRRVLVWEGI
jgi:hypothetical protein